ncbi:hypothetical protein ACMYSQ_011727 [Aspergillus niger]
MTSSRAQLSLSPPDQPCFVCLQSGFLVQLPSPLLILIPLIPFFYFLIPVGILISLPYISFNLIFSHFPSSPPLVASHRPIRLPARALLLVVVIATGRLLPPP